MYACAQLTNEEDVVNLLIDLICYETRCRVYLLNYKDTKYLTAFGQRSNFSGPNFAPFEVLLIK